MSAIKSSASFLKAASNVESAIEKRLVAHDGPLIVALDGGSGAGKSTLAETVVSRMNAAAIHCDDFYTATVTDAEWDSYTPEVRGRLCIDWQRLREEVLRPLLEGKPAEYHPYSFETDSGLAPDTVFVMPAKIILLDGIYSARPEMSDIVDFAILVDASPETRRRRHNLREGHDDADWHARWDPAEDYYFTEVRPAYTFDLRVEL